MDLVSKNNSDYVTWLNDIKKNINQAKIRVSSAANAELIIFYWKLGKNISEKLESSNWGNKVIDMLSSDLKNEFPDSKGFSRQNLYYTKQFYEFYSKYTIVQPPVGQLQIDTNQHFPTSIRQLTWSHNIIIFTKSKSIKEAEFYINQSIENGWSREQLSLQFKSNLFSRIGKSQTNFKNTLPPITSELAQEIIKDPYYFDFVSLTSKIHESDIEKQLISHITDFLLELGKGFAFVGKQYKLSLGENEYFLDLLFYHILLKSYVVIELKNGKFEPSHTGQLNFYLSLVDKILKQDNDNPSIGILLCRDKDTLEVEYALQDIHKPMGISEFNATEILPNDLKSRLPTVEEIEVELNKINN